MRISKIIIYVLTLIYALCVIVQYNDPDPLVWMLIYGLGMLACSFYIMGRLHWIFSVIVGLLAMIWAGILVPDVLGKVSFMDIFSSAYMQNSAVEKARELGGLLIVVTGMVYLSVLQYRFKF
jgi:hypothetical protein